MDLLIYSNLDTVGTLDCIVLSTIKLKLSQRIIMNYIPEKIILNNSAFAIEFSNFPATGSHISHVASICGLASAK